MRVLVTGATGFIGLNVVHRLVEVGDHAVALYRTPPDAEAQGFLDQLGERVTLVQGNVRDAEALSHIVEEHAVEGMIHAAAVTPRRETEKAMPTRIMEINLMGVFHALDAARDHDLQRVVYVSSNAVYAGLTGSDPVTEEAPTGMRSMYTIAKLAGEAACRRYKEMYGMEVASGRVCSTYGTLERPTRSRKGMSAPYQIAHAALEGRTLRVRGLDVVRSWTHAADIAGGLVAMLHAPSLSYDVYNISYGAPYALQEVLDAFEAVEPTLRYEVVEPGVEADIAYQGGEQRGPMDVTRLRQDVGYEPRYDMQTGARFYMEWLRRQRLAV
jgi:nucleoside-diphosphate-sugar epimerase